jgi:hypothetical protein
MPRLPEIPAPVIPVICFYPSISRIPKLDAHLAAIKSRRIPEVPAEGNKTDCLYSPAIGKSGMLPGHTENQPGNG